MSNGYHQNDKSNETSFKLLEICMLVVVGLKSASIDGRVQMFSK